jgi:hypothetical protein
MLSISNAPHRQNFNTIEELPAGGQAKGDGLTDSIFCATAATPAHQRGADRSRRFCSWLRLAEVLRRLQEVVEGKEQATRVSSLA